MTTLRLGGNVYARMAASKMMPAERMRLARLSRQWATADDLAHIWRYGVALKKRAHFMRELDEQIFLAVVGPEQPIPPEDLN